MKVRARWLLFTVGFILVAAIAYQFGRDGFRYGTGAAGGQLPQGWLSHQNPMGFSVSHPRGWEVRADRGTGRVEIAGAQQEQVIVWPVFVPASSSGARSGANVQGRRGVLGGTGSRLATLGPSSASSAMQKLAAKLWPGAAWERPQSTSPTALRMRGRVGDRLAVAVFAWVPSAKGAGGFLYATVAPESRYRSLEETFTGILDSFRLTGAPAQQAQPGLAYVRWHDPRENAFSLDVPSQWRVTGGLFRVATVDTRSAVEVVSPDGQIRITLGDPEVPPFTEPNPMLEMAGFREGGWYSPGYGVRMLVRRYVPGRAFAAEQVRNKLARGCSDLVATEARDRPDVVEALNTAYAQYGQLGVIMRVTAGEIAFTCRSGDQPMRGYYFAGTQLTRGQGTGLWQAPYMCGFLATAEKAGLAQAALERMVKSVEMNPQWVAMQSHLTAETSKIVSRTGQDISNMMADTYWRRQGVMDELDRRRSNVILGVEDVVDPATGRQFKVESGSNYYWIDHGGTVVGTQTDTRPNLDFRELIQLP